MPEHYEGCPMGTATGTDKPLILPGVMVGVLRGELGYTKNCKAVAELGSSFLINWAGGVSPFRVLPTRGMRFPGLSGVVP